jgi:hypothetical protein
MDAYVSIDLLVSSYSSGSQPAARRFISCGLSTIFMFFLFYSQVI